MVEIAEVRISNITVISFISKNCIISMLLTDFGSIGAYAMDLV